MPDERDAPRLRRAKAMHEQLLALNQQKRAADLAFYEAVVALGEGRHFQELGYTSLARYTAHHFGWSASKTSSIVTIWERLPRMPLLRAAFTAGKFGWSKAYLIATGATTPELEARFVDYASEHTDYDLKTFIAQEKGEPVKKKLTVELTPAQAAQVDQKVDELRQVPGNETRDVPSLLADALAEGSAGQARDFLVVVHFCAACKKATIEGRDGPVELPQVDKDCAECCGDVQDQTDPAALGEVKKTVPARIARFVRQRDHNRCRVPECKNAAFVDLHHEGGRDRVGHDPESMFVACSTHHRMRHDGHLRVERLGRGRFRFSTELRVLGEIDIALTDVERRGLGLAREDSVNGTTAGSKRGKAAADAVAALVNLQFSRRDAARMVAAVQPGPDWDAARIVQAALQGLPSKAR